MQFDTRAFLSAPGNEVVVPKKRHWRHGSPAITVIFLVMVTLGLVCFSWATLLNHLDDRVYVTTTDTFHEWMDLKNIFLQTANFSVALNPISLSQAAFEPTPDSLQEWQDLLNRRVITSQEYDSALSQPVQAAGIAWVRGKEGSLLWRLLRTSWCSYPNALPGTTPVTRTPGCDCIAQSYLGFVRDSMNVAPGSVSASVGNSTVAIRDKYSQEVLKCFDRRQVRRTQTCGLVCSIHLAGVILYVNIIMLLSLVTYLLFSEHEALFRSCFSSPFLQTLAIQVLIVGLAAGLSAAFFVRDVTANVLNLVGILLCVIYNTITLHDELDFPAMNESKKYENRRYTGAETRPHPLTVSLLVHLQLILPAYGAVFAISGYGRDVWAVL